MHSRIEHRAENQEAKNEQRNETDMRYWMGIVYRPVLGCWCIDQGVHGMNVSPLAMDGDKTVGRICLMEIDGLYKKGVISETE